MTASRKGRGKSFFHELKKSRTLLLMLLPAAVTIFIFAYLPMGGMILAFKNFNIRTVYGAARGQKVYLTILSFSFCQARLSV